MIFGVDAPKFVYDPAGESEATVLLDYVVVLKDAPELDMITFEADNGHREFIHKGKHWEFEIRVHLFKYYEAGGLAAALAKYNEIKQYEGGDVWLYRHRDADPFMDGDGEEVLFSIISVDESYLDTTDFKDLLIINFKSKDYIDLTDGTTPVVQSNEVIMIGGGII
jgi:hypothetical protein